MEPAAPLVDPRVRRGSRCPDRPDVSIIILVTTGTGRLRSCIASIDLHAGDRSNVEVVVVANGTPADELHWLIERDDLVLLTSTVNLGFGGGCNWAAREARGPALLFMNDDAQATPGWLDALRACIDSDPVIGVAGSRVLLPNGMLQEVGGVIWSDGTTSGVGRGLDAGAPEFAVRRDVDYVSFCSTLVKRRTWDELGGFDEAYFPAYYEDTDLCLRASERGWRVVCEPASEVIHAEGASTAVRWQRFLKQRNRRRFVARWSAFLAACEPPPSLVTGRRAVSRALDRAASRAGQTRQRPPEASAPAGVSSVSPANASPAVSDREVSALQAMVALQQEYTAALLHELDSQGPASVASNQYRAVRALGGRLLTRHPRLSNMVRRVVVSVGNRE